MPPLLLAEERGACPDAAEVGVKEVSVIKHLAPTASISIICGNSSPWNRALLLPNSFIKNLNRLF